MTTIRIAAGNSGVHQFRATGAEIAFEGFYRIAGLPRDIKPSARQEEDDPDAESFERNRRYTA